MAAPKKTLKERIAAYRRMMEAARKAAKESKVGKKT